MLQSTSESFRYVKRTCRSSSFGGTPSGESRSTRRQTYRYFKACVLPIALSPDPTLDSRELG